MKGNWKAGLWVASIAAASAGVLGIVAYTWLSADLPAAPSSQGSGGVIVENGPGSGPGVQPVGPAKAAASDGALTPLSGRPAPDFTLVDQSGKTVALSSFRGKAVVLAPMDTMCTTVCPVLAAEMVSADKSLGPLSKRVVFIAFNVNPYYSGVRYVQAFDRTHGLSGVANWYFLTGDKKALQQVWKDYAIWVQLLPKQKAVNHASYMYFISPEGRELWLSGASANEQLSYSYADLIAQYAKASLRA